MRTIGVLGGITPISPLPLVTASGARSLTAYLVSGQVCVRERVVVSGSQEDLSPARHA